MFLLIINPGGTSTKIAIFENDIEVVQESISHDYKELSKYKTIFDQFDYRKELILDFIKNKGFSLDDFDAIVGRGGLMKSIPGGTYKVNDSMILDLKNKINGEHASNLGAPLAFEIANNIDKPAFVVDPVSVDEFIDISRITGIKEIKKASWLHSLNHKAVCREISKKISKKYEECNYIVAHLGSGISIVAHKKGKMVDGSGGRSDGPFSPERSGGLPTYDLVKLCFSGKYSFDEIVDKISNCGGIYSHLGTKDMKYIEEQVSEGNERYKLILDAFCYKVAKEIASYSATLEGNVDRIIVTGGIAYSDYVVNYIRKKVEWIAKVELIPGEIEMKALANGALRVLNNIEKAKIYE